MSEERAKEGVQISFVEPSVTEIKPEDLLKHIEYCGRTCYNSLDKMTDTSAEKFVRNLVARGHGSVLEHGTVYFLFPREILPHDTPEGKIQRSPYSFSKPRDEYSYYLTTNFRVIVEAFDNDLDKAYDYVMMNDMDCTEHQRRRTFKIVCDRGCYTEDTQILTNNGWRFFYELTNEDLILTKDDDENLLYSSFSPISYHYDGDIYTFKSSKVDLSVTPDHRMWVFDSMKRSKKSKAWKFIQAQDMKNNGYKFSRGANAVQRDRMKITMDDGTSYDQDEFFYFLGLWITDGSIYKRKDYNGFTITITQKKSNVCYKLESVLNSMGLTFSRHKNDYKINSPALGRWLYKEFIKEDNFKKSYYVRIPRNILLQGNASQLESLLAGIMDGDGSHNPRGTEFVYSASIGLMDDLQELLLYIGKCGTIRKTTNRIGEERLLQGHIIRNNVQTYTITLCKVNDAYIRPHRSKTKYGSHLKVEHYNGNVYCVELPKNHRLYVRRNGLALWCGNCSHELVRHRVFSFSQASQRYINSTKAGFEFVKPYWWKDSLEDATLTEKVTQMLFEQECRNCSASYQALIECGFTPQQARGVLPNATKTELVMTGTEKQWGEFLRLRTDKAAHPDMQVIANKIKELL